MKRLILSVAIALMSVVAAQAQKFALIDMEYILQQIPAYAEANQQLDTLSKQWQAEIDKSAKEAKTLYEAYQKDASKLTAAQKTAQEDAIVAKEKATVELRKKYFGPEGELVKKRETLITPIQDAIYTAVKEIALQRKYDVVFDRASSQNMIFASPDIDISDIVLAKMGYSN